MPQDTALLLLLLLLPTENWVVDTVDKGSIEVEV